IGAGNAANTAAAFQAAASTILEQAGWDAAVTAPAHAALGRGGLATAWGQYLDAMDPPADEDTYWRIIRSKTPPLYGASFEIGALAAGASLEVARGFRDLAMPMGELSQIGDDLHDALQIPAEPDWQRQCTNLPILFARLADYPDRQRFAELETRIDERAALEEAQHLLVTSGALSYCALHMIRANREARQQIAALPVDDPDPLHTLFDERIAPLKGLLETCGVENVEELFAGDPDDL
ncbi:MAG: polyprenyl synthetase family protein, partial [Acidobacteriota bacterium]